MRERRTPVAARMRQRTLRISDIFVRCLLAARWLVMTEARAALFGGSNLLSMGSLGNCLGMAKAKDLTQRGSKKAEKNLRKTGDPATGSRQRRWLQDGDACRSVTFLSFRYRE